MTTSTVRRAIASWLLPAMLWSAAWAQDKPEDAAPKRKGTIKGKVMSDDGQPLEGASVSISSSSSSGLSNWRQVQSDDEGNFVAEGLAAGLYTLYIYSSSYVLPDTSGETKYYRLGESDNFMLVKGGVITGRVTNALGEPVIAAPLRVERVSDLEGRKDSPGRWYGQQRRTDDRGVYRIYGLPAGRYVVSVGGRSSHGSGNASVYETDVPTFYPSASREGATEVTVNPGEEVRGIDIRYRREKGFTITGRVLGTSPTSTTMPNGIQVSLSRYPGNGMEQNAYLPPTDATRSFEFFTVPEGEYELEANLYAGDYKDSYKSARKRVTVKSGNVGNLELRLLALSSVEAKVEWDVTPEKERKAECQALRPPLPEETMLWLVQDDPKRDVLASLNFQSRTAIPSEKLELTFKNLEAGNYRFAPRSLDEAWYLKAVTAKADDAKPTDPKSKAPAPKSPLDLGKQSLSLKPGEKRKDIVLTLANGAASLRGRVVADKEQSLPVRLRVHLLPAEKEAADDVLRYAEQKTKDGTFTFTNLAPGKYWLLARKVADDEPDARRPNPLAWDLVTRKTLRAEAEAANVVVELTPCQKAQDVTLKFTPRK